MFPFFRFAAVTAHSFVALVSACLLGLTLGAATPSIARAITPAEYASVGVTLPAGAVVPSDVVVRDEGGHLKSLASLISRPTVLVLSDYRCKTLCGPVLDFTVSALEQSGLSADQFTGLVVALDPKDADSDVRTARQQHLPDNGELDRAISFLTSDQASITRLTQSLGYRYIHDSAADQLVHPAAVFIVRADRHVSRVLTGVGLSGPDLRLALVEAGKGKIGNLSDQVRLLCSAFDPVQGAYTPVVGRALAIASLATLAVLAGGIGFLAFSNRRQA